MAELTIYDPLRKKKVALTPEEEVRQWFISVLHNDLKVPMQLMMSEVGMKCGQLTGVISGVKQKEYRADILVYDRALNPMLVVECKRPDVKLTSAVLEQALRYAELLCVRYLIITNGNSTYFAGSVEGRLRFLDKVPEYEEMIKA
ncbi:MAG: type I restriction enzyme HsdR N-terminal domain-containing protein [Bacteroidales bacterium]|nr:type I restriction enzyme HsdR N-terminal domain-containing protein [Bacteroidales bacterium]